MIILEIVGAIFSISGAYLMSRSSKHNTTPIYWGFVSFFVSNLALLTFFTLVGKVPVIIQMILFFVTAIIGIYKLTNNKLRDSLIISLIVIVYLVALFKTIVPNMSNIDFSVLPLDSVAASIAILGSYLLSHHNHKIRGYAFICFFVADVIFVYIGYINSFYFFMIQSIFYLYTSIRGYLNTMKEEIDIFKINYFK